MALSPSDNHSSALQIVREPRVYLVGRQLLDEGAVRQFLDDEGCMWEADAEVGAHRLIEAAGRLCYMSFGKGRKTNAEYIHHLLEVGHGSVLEHAVWNFIITDVSRSFSHELVRHRAGWGYSQLSQRFVDESTARFIEPDAIAEDPALHQIWAECIEHCQGAYADLVSGLAEKFSGMEDKTLRHKLARQAARSVLPNATETKIFVTANARALRNFIELRGSEHAETEIRKVAIQMLKILREEAPNLFGDYTITCLPDGTEVAQTPFTKV